MAKRGRPKGSKNSEVKKPESVVGKALNLLSNECEEIEEKILELQERKDYLEASIDELKPLV